MVKSVCALHISPKDWNHTMNNGIKTRFQQIIEAYNDKLPKCTSDLLKLGTLETKVAKALSEVFEDYISPVREQFVSDMHSQGFSCDALGNLAVFDILQGKLNGKPKEDIRDYSQIENSSYRCLRLGNENLDMYVIATVPIPMYVDPNLTTAYIGDKGWGVLESIKAKYQQPAIPTGTWLKSLQPDPQDLAPLFGIISYGQIKKWIPYLSDYIVKHSDVYKRKGIRSVQERLPGFSDDKVITSVKTKKRRKRKPDASSRLRQIKLVNF